MTPATRIALLLLLLLAAPVLRAAGSADGAREPIGYGPVPAWVDASDLPDGDGVAAASGLRYLLVDDQWNAAVPVPVSYTRLAFEIVDRSGLEEGGRFSIDFQPDFHRVTLHAIRVHRDGRWIDRTRESRIDVLRTEDDADVGILDGWRKASLLIPDVRVGDRVDFAYSVAGINPVFGALRSEVMSAAYSQGVAKRVVRALGPVGSPLRWRALGPADYVMDVRVDGGVEARRFVAQPLAPVQHEAGAPDGFDGYGSLSFSNADGWGDVVRWARPLFDGGDRGARYAELLAEVRGAGSDDGALRRALEAAQRDVRYVSLSIGRSSHAPASPEATLLRRFGDCKDKSRLLVALLRDAGVAAEPVFVDTVKRGRIDERLAGPSAFDHVIVRARVNGAWRYVDPTRDVEVGRSDDLAPVQFLRGLPVGEGVDDLVDIPIDPPTDDEADVRQEIVRAPEKTDDDAFPQVDLTVASTYRRGQANRVRAHFLEDGATQVGREYLDYMRGIYRDIRVSVDPVIVDDAERNVVAVTERYRAPMFADDEGGSGHEFNLRLFQIADWLPESALPERRWPLALGGPRRGSQQIRMTLAGGWDIEPERVVVENAAFRFERVVEAEGDTLRVQGRWERRADEIAPADYPAIRADLKAVDDLLDYSIFVGGDVAAAATVLWRDLVWVAFAIALTAGLLVGLYAARTRSLLGALMFAPSEAGHSLRERPRLGWGVALMAVASVVLLLWERLPVLLGGVDESPLPWWQTLPIDMAFWLVGAVLAWAALRALRVATPWRPVIAAGLWSGLPLLLFFGTALVAFGPSLPTIADAVVDGPEVVTGSMMVVGVLLLVVGLCWYVVTTVAATARAAECTIGHVIVAMALSIPVLVAMTAAAMALGVM